MRALDPAAPCDRTDLRCRLCQSRRGESPLKILIAGLFLLFAVIAAQAEGLEAGQWKVTTTTIIGGPPSPPQVKLRCLTPQQVADPGKTFSPEVSTVNSNCERTEYRLDKSGLSWRLQCKGQLDMDVAGQFTFESAVRYTAIVTTRAAMTGQPTQSTAAAIEGERVGPCP